MTSFDNKGHFLNRIGTNGSGPEEYDFPDDIAYDKYNDELLVWCRNKKRIMCFKLDGTFIKNIATDYWGASIFAIAENTYLLYLNNIIQKKGVLNDYNMLVIDKNGKQLNHLLPVDQNKKYFSPPSQNVFSIYNDEILFSPQYSSKVFSIKQNEIETKYYLDFGKFSIPSSLFINTNFRDFSKAIKENGYAFNIAAMETSSHVITQFVYEKTIFDCYYSKKSQKAMIASIYLNDIYGLSPNRNNLYTIGDSIISYVQPSSFVTFQKILANLKNKKKDISNLLLSQLTSPLASIFNNDLKKNYSEAIKSTQIVIDDDEFNFINSITEDDNPIIMIAKLKKF